MLYFSNYAKKRLKKRISLTNNFYINIFLCGILQIIVLFASVEISKIYKLRIYRLGFLNFYLKQKKIIFLFYFVFIITFSSITFILIFFIGENGLQVSNFTFFVLLTFELFLEIGRSKKFEDWIGTSLDENLRIFILFIIFLNVVYFLTRISYSISQIKF